MSTLYWQTPAGSFYQKMHRIKGKAQRKVHILHENGQIYTSIPDVADKLAQTFSKVSSDQNYSNHFMRYKTQGESQVIDFTSDNSEPYNKPFTLDELSYCLSNTKDTSPREEEIHYKMIKHVPDNAKQHLVDIFNKFYRCSFFLTQWNTAIVTAIPKPEKIIAYQPTIDLLHLPAANARLLSAK